MKFNIAFIGSVGVPNNYGGFEMFLEACGPELTKSFDDVFITCDRSRYEQRSRLWNGVKRVFIPVRANGAMSVLHDLLAFLAVFWRVRAIVVLGVSGGLFFPLFRILCSIFRKKLLVNVDGVEWRRAKFSRSRRYFLLISDRLAQACAHRLIVDNDALRPFLIKTRRASASLIAYPGDHVRRVERRPENAGPTKSARCLTICRIEPENNCHMLIEGFMRAGYGEYVFVGNWNASEYGRSLRAKYAHVKGLEMRDPVYDKKVLAELRENCTLYLHGHSVGGTNPSLVEMLFYDCAVAAFACDFNKYTAGDAIEYFAGEDQLAGRIRQSESVAQSNRDEVRQQYTKERICGAYADLIFDTCGRRGFSPAQVEWTEGKQVGEMQPR
jgi:glycosyltransferase involved in cell wall biosynthesis